MKTSESKKVIEGGYCVGCGLCVALAPNSSYIWMDENGRYVPEFKPDHFTPFICPFSTELPNEDDLAERYLPDACQNDPLIGRYINSFAGYVRNDKKRSASTSGGLTTWIAVKLLLTGFVDKVIHVKPNIAEDGPLFHYDISSTPKEVYEGAKTRYYPIELSKVLRTILSEPGRYLVIGLPCYIKAVRLLCDHSPTARERIVFTIGLFCGSLKTARFTDLLGWQMGIPPGEVGTIDFRDKKNLPDATHYTSRITDRQGNQKLAHWNELYGVWWGHGYNKYKACDYCDDVVSETADVSVGDAWLPAYQGDPKGTNIVIVRSNIARDILKEGKQSQEIYLDLLNSAEVCESQASNFRHRRDGLAYRLYQKDLKSEWRPVKRVSPDINHLSAREQKIYYYRELLSARSHPALTTAINKNDLSLYLKLLERYRMRYELLYHNNLKRWIRFVLSWIWPNLLVKAWLRRRR
ncbi:MAG: Coenzyme F420 hydrogenase/dehydrogenase, beta subunit C-terminal domain [Sedimenticola sp.]